MKKKSNPTETRLEKAEKALKGFIKTLEKDGFTDTIHKHLNLAWQSNHELFEMSKSGLKGIEFKVEDVKYITCHMPETVYRFEAQVNGEKTNLFVQPLIEGNIPVSNGFYGVIPVKLMKFIPKEEKIDNEIIEEIKEESYKKPKVKKSKKVK